jgi:hypothetical protein
MKHYAGARECAQFGPTQWIGTGADRPPVRLDIDIDTGNAVEMMGRDRRHPPFTASRVLSGGELVLGWRAGPYQAYFTSRILHFNFKR